MAYRKMAFLVSLAALILFGCGLAASATETQPPSVPTHTLPPADTATATLDVLATQGAQQTIDAQASRDGEATAQSERATQAVDDKRATATQKQFRVLEQTAQIEETAAAKEAAFEEIVDKLYADGVVMSKDGDYYNLDEFEQSQAQIDTPFVQFLQLSAVDFMISADMAWESASDNANWPTSGCGFVYGYKDRFNADLTFLGLDGYTHSLQFREDRPVGQFAFKKWGNPERPKGNAKAMLVVSNKRVYVYVNDELANDFYNGLYTGGELGLNIFSGTNKGYGTRCNFSNIQIYILN